MQEKQPGRPLGPIAESVLELLVSQSPLSVREISNELQLTINIAALTCQRLVMRGRIRVVRRIRQAGVNKPVAMYGLVRQLPQTVDYQCCYFRNS